MTKTLSIVIFLIVCTSPLYADLRYTTRVEIRRASGSASADIVAIGALLQGLMPPGITTTLVSGDAIRIEQTIGTTRSVVLMGPAGHCILYPDQQTYWRMPELGNLLADSLSSPAPTFVRTGEFMTLLGLRAERIQVTMPIVMPVMLPAGAPTRMTLEGELWVADAYRADARGVQKALGPIASLTGILEGMVLRQRLRHPESGYEIESTVVDLNDGAIPADMFRVPPGYRQVSQAIVSSPAPGGARRTQP